MQNSDLFVHTRLKNKNNADKTKQKMSSSSAYSKFGFPKS